MHSVISHKAPIKQRALVNVDQERGTGASLLHVRACGIYSYCCCRSNRNLLGAVFTTKGAF